MIPSVPEAPQPADAAPTTPAVETGSTIVSGVRRAMLVPAGASPRTITAGNPRTSWTVRVPGWWTAARGRLTLKLAGNRQLAPSSRVAVSIGGRQVAAGRAWPGQRTISVDLPATDLGGNQTLPIEVSATLATKLGQCAAPDDRPPRSRCCPAPGSNSRAPSTAARDPRPARGTRRHGG